MANPIAFNTGRLYTSAGQRIAAKLTADGGILFVDVDRMIDGYIPADKVRELQLTLSHRDVLWAYDHHDRSGCYNGRYKGSVNSQEEIAALRRYAGEHAPALAR